MNSVPCVWLATSASIKCLIKHFKAIQSLDHESETDTLSSLAKDPTEKLHLSYIRWTLGVHKYTSIFPLWGDTGRFPLVITLAKQVFSYLERLKLLDLEDSPTFVRHAFAELKYRLIL